MTLRFYDTASATTRDFVPVHPGEAGLYYCGATVQGAPHIGHVRSALVFDVLARWLRFRGYRVTTVRNVTDIDDKILANSAASYQEGFTGEHPLEQWWALAYRFEGVFGRAYAALGIDRPTYEPRATGHVPEMHALIQELVDAGHAYPALDDSGDVYFDVDAAGQLREDDPDAWVVGSTCRMDREQMMPLFADHGGDPDRTGKRDALDPLLWRVERPGEPSWDGGSLDRGRPGWHIECSVIALKYLPTPFTVQGGGSDLAFPHHDMGAGHAYALSSEPMAQHYVHTAMVGLDGEKMSKSKGNLVLVSTLRQQGVDPAAIRVAILSNHYRTDWFWTDELLEDSQRRLARWREAAAKPETAGAQALLEAVRAALAEDLNAPAALLAVDAWAARNLGGAAAHGSEASAEDAQLARNTLEALLGVVL